MPTTLPSGGTLSELPSPRRVRAARLRHDLQALLFLVTPIVVAVVAVVLMLHVMRASSVDLRASEVISRMNVVAVRIESAVRAARSGGGFDSAQFVRDLDAYHDALAELSERRPVRSVLGPMRGAAPAGDLAAVQRVWRSAEAPLRAWSRDGMPARGELATLATELSQSTELLARGAENVSRTDEREHLGLISLLLILQIVGLLMGALAKLIDMRRLRRHEHRLAHLSHVTQHTASSIVLCDPDGRVTYANESFLRSTGWRATEVMGKHALELVSCPGETCDGVVELGRALASRSPFAGELELRRRDGTAYWANLELTPLRDDDGELHQLAVLFTDVTARITAVRALQATEARFSAAIAAMGEGFMMLDADGDVVQSNESARRILGLPAGERVHFFSSLSRWNVVDVTGQPMSREQSPAAITLRTGEPQRLTILGMDDPSGIRRWLAVSTAPFQLPDGGRHGVVSTFADITENRRAEEGLRLLTSVVADSPTIVLITGPEDRLEYVNAAFERRTGWSLAEVRGRSTEFMLSPRTPSETWVELMASLARGGSWRGEIYNTTRAGETWLAISQVYVLKDLGGRVTHRVAMLQDITEERRRKEELNEAREAALAAARAKNEFLQNMSHELRTPLNGILGLSELILHTPLEAQQRADLIQMRRSAEDLLTVITHLFDFARIEAGNGRRETLPFRLRGCVDEVRSVLASDAEARGLRWRVDVQADMPDVRVGDPGSLRQVLLCLASNAVKFTERGEVVLHVAPEAEIDGHPAVRFEMRDTGIGIPPDRQVEIFEAFSQVDGSSTRKYGGIGLGLALAARLVRQMGGRLDVTSEQASGSVFAFVIPLEVAPDSMLRDVEPAAAAAIAPPLAAHHVLLVVGHAPVRSSTLSALQRAGATLDVIVGGARDADMIECLRAAEPPCRAIVLDQRDGGFDAFAVTARLRQSLGAMLPPVVLFTAAGQRGDAARCRELGIAGYLSQPAGDGDLVEALRHLQPAGAPPGPLVTRHLLREGRPHRRALVVDDNAVNRKVASRLLERSGYEVATAVHGRDAVEKFSASAWDVVLMDVQMPEMDGLEAARHIRALERERQLPRTPILAVTAHTLDGDRQAVIEAGMDELVAKPIVADHLLATIQRYLADAPIALPDASQSPAIADVLDWNEALERMDGDADVLHHLLQIFLDDSPQIMLRLEEARESGEAQLLERAAHSLKGASGTISARHVQPLASEVETLAREGRLNEARDRFDDLRHEMQRLVRALETLPPRQDREAA